MICAALLVKRLVKLLVKRLVKLLVKRLVKLLVKLPWAGQTPGRLVKRAGPEAQRVAQPMLKCPT